MLLLAKLHPVSRRRRAALAVALVPVPFLLVAPRAKAVQPWPDLDWEIFVVAWDRGGVARDPLRLPREGGW